jgi:hypothetical protein
MSGGPRLAMGCPLGGRIERLVERHDPDLRALPGRDFDFNLYAWVRQTGGDHYCRWTHLSEIPAQHRPALFKVSAVWQNVSYANDVF